MECVVDDESPLARVLLEGDGLGQDEAVHEMLESTNGDTSPHFAPNAMSAKRLQARLRSRLGHPLKIAIPPQGPVARIQHAYSDAVSSRIRHKDNERFLEQFRYIIITSNLQNEQAGRSSFNPSLPTLKHQTSSDELILASWTIEGAAIAVGLPATLAGLLRWTTTYETSLQLWVQILVVILFLVVGTVTLLAYVRRQGLLVIRQKAVKIAGALVTNFQALDQSSSAALTMVREIELVSRGYRLGGNMLPPISTIEDNRSSPQSRRCIRIRRLLNRLYSETIPVMIKQCNILEDLVLQDDLEKYLDINEIAEPEVKEAFAGVLISEIDDQESLSALRAMNWRFNILRQVFLCHLLAVPADGSKHDFPAWQTASMAMKNLASLSEHWVENLNDILKEDEQMIRTPSTPTHRNSPERERVRQQLRKANELSAELRAIQAKLHILRDDATRILDGEGNIHAVTPLFNSQADSIGQDLRSLNHAYESWKHSLLVPADRSDRRKSRPSSEIRSPVSLGGLTVVDEDGVLYGPSKALKVLNGDSSGSGGSPMGSDEEVFEAMAIPRTRVLTREQKIAKMHDEEARRAIAREQRMQTTNMVQELETVINTRFSNRMSTGRIPHNSRISSI